MACGANSPRPGTSPFPGRYSVIVRKAPPGGMRPVARVPNSPSSNGSAKVAACRVGSPCRRRKMRPSQPWSRSTEIPCAETITAPSGPQSCDQRDGQYRLRGQRPGPNSRPPGVDRPVQPRKVVRPLHPSAGQKGRSAGGAEEPHDHGAGSRPARQERGEQGDIDERGGHDRAHAHAELPAEGDAVDPAPVLPKPVLVHLAPPRRQPPAEVEGEPRC